MTANCSLGLQYQSGRLLGSDNFGDIHLDRNNETREYRSYHILGKHDGIPLIQFYGHIDSCNAVVMELLGPLLEDLFD